MSKRLSVSICVFLLVLVFATCLVIKPVHAESSPMSNAYKSIEDTIGGLFSRFSENPAVWMRILIVIGLFAVLFFGASKLGFQKNIAVVIALVIAIMASIGIPDAVLVFLAQTYGAIFQIILVLIPGVGLAWLTWIVHRKIESGWTIVVLVFVWLAFIAVITTFADTINKTATEAVAAQQAIGITIVGSCIIIVILIISGLIRMGGGGVERGWMGSLVPKLRRVVGAETKLGIQSLAFLEDAKRKIQAANWNGALVELKKVEQLDVYERNADIVLLRIDEKIKKLEGENHPEARGLRRELERVNNAARGLMVIIVELRRAIKSCEKAVTEPRHQPHAIKAIDICIGLDRTMIAMAERLIQLENIVDKRSRL